jgi:hypothetical protein
MNPRQLVFHRGGMKPSDDIVAHIHMIVHVYSTIPHHTYY